MSREIDVVLYLVCDGCRKIGTFRAPDRLTVLSRARIGGWALRTTKDLCHECEDRERHQG